VAIEKNYFSTYGWEVDDAYYKIKDDYIKSNEDEDDHNYQFTFEVFRNKAARDRDEKPLSANYNMRLVIDPTKFDNKLTKDQNIKTQMYEYLKVFTNSFKTEGKDV